MKQHERVSVMKHPAGGWAIVKPGGARALRRFPERPDAVAHARQRAAVVYVHRADGMVERREER